MAQFLEKMGVPEPTPDLKTFEIKVRGIVQGVGFRPFIYRLAKRFGLTGFVSNTEEGVLIKASGDLNSLEGFLVSIRNEAPPLSRILDIQKRELEFKAFDTFKVISSSKSGKVSTQIPPDIATCRECIDDILERDNRRYHYPFTNCTNCGPRYTIIESLPYDRPKTSMKVFKMCPECQREYNDPENRRFHAQPNACPLCGPRLIYKEGEKEDGNRPLEAAARSLKDGKIVAIKGLGGFHIAVSAYHDNGISLLRKRKNRPFKPFAVMVKDIETAKRICHVDDGSMSLLTSQMAPIVLMPKKENGISRLVSPNLFELGVMLPYTPLHYLLFMTEPCPDCLIMTSGNFSGEPLCTKNEEALLRLSRFCDGFLLHNREIYTGVDDSVIRTSSDKSIFIRRSRGYAPSPIPIKSTCKKEILAVGAELKNTFCLYKDGLSYLSQHVGDLKNSPTLNFFKRNIKHLETLLEITPEICVHDFHPDYLSSRYARERGPKLIGVQHHFAHAASVMAEHGVRGPALAIVLDGVGLGTDGTIWGGELLFCNGASFRRLSSLRPFRLPGGDMASREPWRSLLAILTEMGLSEEMPGSVDPVKVAFLKEMIEKGINCPVTTSCGRLFDAVSSLLDICHINTYEAQAAMELEALCLSYLSGRNIVDTRAFKEVQKMDFLKKGSWTDLEIDWQPIIELLLKRAGEERAYLSALFHAFLIEGFSRAMLYFCEKFAVDKVLLGGGSFQNRVLLDGFFRFLEDKNINCLFNRNVPSNDGGISLGQAYVACLLNQE